jgi:hypothetical protein
MLERIPQYASEFAEQNTKPATTPKKLKSVEHEMALEN